MPNTPVSPGRMRAVLLFIAVGALSAMSTPAAAPPAVKHVEARQEGLYVNGKPFFPVGIGWVGHSHFSLPDAGEKGFNLAVAHARDPQEFRMDIDDAYANGMYAVAHLGNGLWRDIKQVERIVLASRDAPGLLVWDLEDEPNIRQPGPQDKGKDHLELPYRMPPKQFQTVYDLIKRLDPAHPILMNLAYGYLKDHQDYRDVADIQSDNVYPVPAAPLTHVANYSDSVIRGQAGKPGWMWIQMAPMHCGAGYTHEGGIPDRAPTMTEVRCMTYLAAAHGISGVMYFAFHFNEGGDWWVNQSEPAYWAQWADLTGELRLLTPYLVSPQVPGVAAEILEGNKEPAEFGYRALHLSLRKTESGYFLIAVNGFNSPVKARLKLPVPAEGFATDGAAVRFEHRLVPIKEGVVEDFFAPYAVHLYEIPFHVKVTGSPSNEPITWPKWQRRPRP